jgi:nitrite reductase/ring-hydroxylating ferredoxin subunit
MLGKTLVAFRTAGGHLAVLDGRCAHLGADLGRGFVAGEAIRCPFHHWEYGPDGRCTHVPNVTAVPDFARQMSYPAVERHGHVFFFNGPEPLFPLPFFLDCRPEDFVAGRPFRFVAECSWFMLAANGFDVAHFQAVHDRTLLGPGVVDCPAPLARRMRYRARVTGRSVFDRLIRWAAGDKVEVAITNWGGPLILVTGSFRRARSYILIATHPLPAGRTQAEVLVFAPRGGALAAPLRPLGLWVRRLFTRAFMQDDIDRLGGIRYNPTGLIETDRELTEFFRWVAALPRGPGELGGGVRRQAGGTVRANGTSCKERS